MSAVGKAIVVKDWTELRRDPRVVVMMLVAVILALAAVATSYTQVAAYETDRMATEARDRQTWLGQGARNPHGAAHFSSWAMRPLTPLALLDPGVTPYAGTAIWMEAHKQNAPRNRPVQDSASTFDSGQFSLAWALQIIVPLLLFVIGAGAIARERERGTLRMMVASGGNAGRIATAKLGVLARVGAIVLVPVVAIAAGAALLLPGANDADQPLRLLLWLLSYAVFLFIAVAVAIAVSAVASTASRALLALIAIWLVAALLAPRVASGVATMLHSTPAPEVFAARVAEDRAKFSDGHASPAEALKAIVLKRYNVSRVEDLPVNVSGLQLEEGERQGNLVFDRHFGTLAEIYDRQRMVSRVVGAASPLVSLQNISMALAGTDMPSQIAFQRQAEQHRRSVITMLNTDMIRNAGDEDFDYKADPRLWRTIPEFAFRQPPLATVLRAIWPDVAILFGWTLAGWAILRGAQRRLAREAL